MAVVKVYDQDKTEQGELTLTPEVFEVAVRPEILHLVVRAQLAAKRAGTHSTKTRAMVSGGGVKPWRQKGTGRARAGMTSSPLWRKGGRAFPNLPEENFSQKINKKMYRAAIASILSKLVADGRLVVVDSLDVDTPKTKAFAAKAKALGVADSALFIANDVSDNLYLASRNLKNVSVVTPRYADPLSLIHYKKVVVEKAAVAKLEEMLG